MSESGLSACAVPIRVVLSTALRATAKAGFFTGASETVRAIVIGDFVYDI